jgi:hypothetical protein
LNLRETPIPLTCAGWTLTYSALEAEPRPFLRGMEPGLTTGNPSLLQHIFQDNIKNILNLEKKKKEVT